jgi:hypothetical protein
MFGFLVVPLGATSIVLVILQPVAVGTWCTLCLITAAAMLAMIPLALDEVVAMLQFMAHTKRAGKPLWRTFWVGGTLDDLTEDARTPRLTASPAKLAPAMVWGVTAPWNLLLTAALGLWLMAAPAVFGSQGGAADSDHLVGALVVTVAVIALAEVGRCALPTCCSARGLWRRPGSWEARRWARPGTMWRWGRRWSCSACAAVWCGIATAAGPASWCDHAKASGS